MAATPTTTTTTAAGAAGLHAPLKPAACTGADTTESDYPNYVEGVDVQFWQPTAEVSVPLDENGKPAFYQECSDAIRYSSECILYVFIRVVDYELNRLSSLDDDHAHSGLYPTILPCNLPTICTLPLP